MPGTRLEHDHHLILVASTILARLTIWVVGVYAIVQGAGIIWGGRDRWSSPSYAVALHMPYAPTSWGVALILAGLLTLVGSLARRWRVKAAGLVAIAIWSWFFGRATFAAALQSPLAGTTGPIVYWKDALVVGILIMVDERRRE
jgi:hypothetical protein